jgi:glycosyltransferase involved in cell wall biosynthesis
MVERTIMRIVQLVETLEVGGLERLTVNLALSQRTTGHEVSVYCLFGAGPLRAELDGAGIPVVTFHKEDRSKAAITWSLARQLRRDRPDVIHGHNPGVHHFAAVAKRLAGVPVCVNTRHSALSSTGAPYQERYFRWVKPLTDHVVFDCNFVRQQLEPHLRYPTCKCSVILNGIFYEPFLWHPAAPGSKPPRIRFGTIGRLVPAKGQAQLVEAFSIIAPRLPNAELCIFGSGPLEVELRAQIQGLGLEGRVRLEGRTDDPARALELFDVFVLSSITEGLPLVILEAMAAGLPIVSTRVGGISEVAPEHTTSWLCEPGNAADLARAMLQAAESPALAAIGDAARRLALANYGIAQMSHHYEQLYTNLLAARNSRRAR